MQRYYATTILSANQREVGKQRRGKCLKKLRCISRCGSYFVIYAYIQETSTLWHYKNHFFNPNEHENLQNELIWMLILSVFIVLEKMKNHNCFLCLFYFWKFLFCRLSLYMFIDKKNYCTFIYLYLSFIKIIIKRWVCVFFVWKFVVLFIGIFFVLCLCDLGECEGNHSYSLIFYLLWFFYKLPISFPNTAICP